MVVVTSREELTADDEDCGTLEAVEESRPIVVGVLVKAVAGCVEEEEMIATGFLEVVDVLCGFRVEEDCVFGFVVVDCAGLLVLVVVGKRGFLVVVDDGLVVGLVVGFLLVGLIGGRAVGLEGLVVATEGRGRFVLIGGLVEGLVDEGLRGAAARINGGAN